MLQFAAYLTAIHTRADLAQCASCVMPVIAFLMPDPTSGASPSRDFPDLTVSATLASSYLAGGTAAPIPIAVSKTEGALLGGTNVSVRLFLSTNSAWEAGVDTEVWSSAPGDFPVKELEAFGISTQTATSVAIPNVAAGNYYLLAVVDPDGNFFEVSETNNVFASPVSITTPPPDLSVSASFIIVVGGYPASGSVAITRSGGLLAPGGTLWATIALPNQDGPCMWISELQGWITAVSVSTDELNAYGSVTKSYSGAAPFYPPVFGLSPTLVATISSVPGEVNLTNNKYCGGALYFHPPAIYVLNQPSATLEITNGSPVLHVSTFISYHPSYPGPFSQLPPGQPVGMRVFLTGADDVYGMPQVLAADVSQVTTTDFVNSQGDTNPLNVDIQLPWLPNGDYAAIVEFDTALPDIPFSWNTGNPIHLYFSIQNPRFETSTISATVPSSVLDVVAGDLNHDGLPDLVSANGDLNTVSVLLATRQGAYGTTTTLTSGLRPDCIATADLNLDGKLDLLIGNFDDWNLTRYLGIGDGSFSLKQSFPSNNRVSAISIGDINTDGLPDVVVANEFSQGISVLIGNGQGLLDPPVLNAVDFGPCGVVIADLNGDVKPEIATSNRFSNNLTVLRGTGQATMGACQYIAVGVPQESIAAADVTGDGRLDLIVASESAGQLTWFEGNGSGGVGPPQAVPAGVAPGSVLASDFTADGLTDVVVRNHVNPGSISLLPGKSGGGFSAIDAYQTGSNPIAAICTDFNLDGFLDVITASGLTGTLTAHANAHGVPAGLLSYGTGTQGCAGIVGIVAPLTPILGNSNFTIRAANAPPSSNGIAIISTLTSAGVDEFSLGVTQHVGLLGASELYVLEMASDAMGNARSVPATIPANPILAGVTYYAQTLWIETAAQGLSCSTAQAKVVMSKGLSITFQP